MSAPAYRAYTVIKREPLPDGKNNDWWQPVGVAYKHEDGEGMNILLQSMPLDGKIVLRVFKEKPEEKPEQAAEKVVKGKFYAKK